jgi:hypothetical protein
MEMVDLVLPTKLSGLQLSETIERSEMLKVNI